MIEQILENARRASRTLGSADRVAMLLAIREALTLATDTVMQANVLDVALAEAQGMSAPMLDRLSLDRARWAQILASIDAVAKLPDPLGVQLDAFEHANGMRLRKITVPFGVIGIVFESRPNVAVDASILALKAGSAVVLRGSSSALNTNRALVNAMRAGLLAAGVDRCAISLIDSSDRAHVTALLHARGKVDLVIPRGGAELIAHVVENARVPVIETGVGVCHLYVHSSADLTQARAILLNGKVSRPGVCNSLETLLVDSAIAAEFLQDAFVELVAAGVEIRGDQRVCALSNLAVLATEDDFGREFLDLILAVKVVDGMEEALAHIERHSTRHSEAICATDDAACARFESAVDAAAVYVNASTRFTDGFEFGFAAEIGISTQKMHARGPMGLREIVTWKYLISGQGQVR